MKQASPYPRIAECRRATLSSLAALADGDENPKTLHRARTELRRLQALLDLLGEPARALRIADCVSTLSKLRAMHVFDKYLRTVRAPRRDRRRIAKRITKLVRKHRRKRVYRTIGMHIRRQTTKLHRQSEDWIVGRFRLLRHEQADALIQQLETATANPRRRILHALRLLIKAVRYQEELALLYPFGNPDVVKRLKAAQTVLGEYEEQAEFRKLGRTLRLSCKRQLKKDWRRARKRARLVPADLADIPSLLTDERLRFLYPRVPSAKPHTRVQQGA
jgi:hypothetical protein